MKVLEFRRFSKFFFFRKYFVFFFSLLVPPHSTSYNSTLGSVLSDLVKLCSKVVQFGNILF